MTAEADLVRRAQRGDSLAFDELIAPRWDRIHRIALRIVGQKQEAEDVAQKACIRLWETFDRFDATGDLDGWIYRMVTNLSIDSLRRRKAQPEEAWPVSRDGSMTFDPADEAHGPEERAFSRELDKAMQQLTDSLPPKQKAVFVLTRVEGLSTAEVSRILDVSESTVRNHLFQLRGQLSRQLRERYPELMGGKDPRSGGDA